MSLRKLPSMAIGVAPKDVMVFDAPPQAYEHWNAALQPAEMLAGEDNVVPILDVIGESSLFGSASGVSAKNVQRQLAGMKTGRIKVLMNSPGGMVTEGVAIFNLLMQHPLPVDIDVLGMAGSIASIIAMAGDKVRIAKSGFFMIHNSSTLAAGNRHEMKSAMDWLGMVDEAMTEVYAARTGLAPETVATMMDRETRMRANDAIGNGFADALLAPDQVTAREPRVTERAAPAAHRIEALLARAGLSRSERGKLLDEFRTGTQIAAEVTTQIAGDQKMAEALETLRSIKL